MPVWILGQKTDKVIIFVHGGPGLSGLIFHSATFIQLLSQKYRVVLYDQRGSGASRGHPTTQSITLDQHVKDLDGLVDLVMTKYPHSEIHLLGYSFGGLIAAAFATQYQDRIKTLALYSPLLSVDRLSKSLSQHMITKFIDPYLARKNISQKSRKEWEKIKKFYQKHSVLGLDSFLEHNTYSTKLEEILNIDYSTKYYKKTVPTLFKDPFFEIMHLMSQVRTSMKNLDNNKENFRDLETDPVYHLSKITLPVMMITGSSDFVVPEEVSLMGYNLIKSTDKTHYSLKEASHAGFLVHPEQSVQYIETLIQK
ncbi:MAG: alpha/beta fold hydrolase [Brevinema sp.]